MRARLSEAAYAVVAERGYAALRIAAVAERAGVSQGALLHHFPDKDALALTAISHVFNLARDESERNLAQCPRSLEPLLRLMLKDFNTFFFGDWFWVSLGITLDASKNDNLAPKIAAVAAELRQPVYDRWGNALAGLGLPSPKAQQIVREAAELCAGAAVRKLWAKPDSVAQAIEEDWIIAKLSALGAYTKSGVEG